MGKCVPGMSCYQGGDIKVYYTYPKGCSSSIPTNQTIPISSNYIFYAGPNLPYTGIQTDDDLTTALQKIDVFFDPETIFDLFLAAIDNNPALKTLLCSRISTCP